MEIIYFFEVIKNVFHQLNKLMDNKKILTWAIDFFETGEIATLRKLTWPMTNYEYNLSTIKNIWQCI